MYLIGLLFSRLPTLSWILYCNPQLIASTRTVPRFVISSWCFYLCQKYRHIFIYLMLHSTFPMTFVEISERCRIKNNFHCTIILISSENAFNLQMCEFKFYLCMNANLVDVDYRPHFLLKQCTILFYYPYNTVYNLTACTIIFTLQIPIFSPMFICFYHLHVIENLYNLHYKIMHAQLNGRTTFTTSASRNPQHLYFLLPTVAAPCG